MSDLIIKKKDLDSDNYYVGDASDVEGRIKIEGGLGHVRFKGWLCASLSIVADAGSGIEAGEGIKAGWGIKAGLGIKAGWGIKAGLGIKAGWGIKAGLGIKAGRGIEAGEGIEAGWGIEAGSGIEAGWGIEAGSGIKAGWGIKAGRGIKAKKAISAKLRIFAGLCIWREPWPEELEIRCSKLESGRVCFGTLIETGEEESADCRRLRELEAEIAEIKSRCCA